MENLTNNQDVNTTANTTIEQPYNHEASIVDEAVGINIDDINKRTKEMFDSLPEKLSASILTEAFENNFSKRELAFMLERKSYELGQIMNNPFAGLLGGQDED